MRVLDNRLAALTRPLPDKSSILQVTRIAGANISALRMVKTRTDGEVDYASADDIDQAGFAIGLAITVALEGDEIKVLRDGPWEHETWDWAPQQDLFLSTNGNLTQTPPATGFIQAVGWAVSATSVYISISRNAIIRADSGTRYLALNDGQITETVAPVISFGASSAGAIFSADEDGKLNFSTMPDGVRPPTLLMSSSGTIAAGDFVNIFNSGGEAFARRADNVLGRMAHGYVKFPPAGLGDVVVYLTGSNAVTGAAIGAVWLGQDGGFLTTKPTSTDMLQLLGVAISTTEIRFTPSLMEPSTAPPTDLSITNGTTGGPEINSSTGESVTFPSASGTISGVVTAGNQTFAGVKTFTSDATIHGATVGRGSGAVLSNTAVGNGALSSNTSGSSNTASGRLALLDNTTGVNNTANGVGALQSNTTGANNTASGRGALLDNTTGSNNIGLGLSAGRSGSPRLITTQSNEICIGNNNHTRAFIRIAFTATSDERDKAEFAPIPHGLDFVLALQPTEYQFKAGDRDGEADGIRRYGFLAQDVLVAEGDNPVIVNNDDPDNLKMTHDYLIPVLVNAVKELTAQVNVLMTEVVELKGR